MCRAAASHHWVPHPPFSIFFLTNYLHHCILYFVFLFLCILTFLYFCVLYFCTCLTFWMTADTYVTGFPIPLFQFSFSSKYSPSRMYLRSCNLPLLDTHIQARCWICKLSRILHKKKKGRECGYYQACTLRIVHTHANLSKKQIPQMFLHFGRTYGWTMKDHTSLNSISISQRKRFWISTNLKRLPFQPFLV